MPQIFKIADLIKKTLLVIFYLPKYLINKELSIKKILNVFNATNFYRTWQYLYDFIRLRNNQKTKKITKKYNTWIKEKEFSIIKNKEKKINEAKSWKLKPKFSIIVPIYNIDIKTLKKTINSVENQIYDNWELCLTNANKKRNIINYLNELSKNNKKIKLKHLEKNLGISNNSNEAIKLSTGDFITLLDHDDELSINALWEVTKLINKNPHADIIYTDEDKINPKNKYCDPVFKPDYSPDLLFSNCYFCHLTVIRKKIIDEIGSFRKEFDGAQDHDLFLRATEKTDNIFHIPKILYHWRMSKNSTALDINNKPYCLTAQIKVIEDTIKRRNLDAFLENKKGFNYIRYKIRENKLVSIIIPTKDQPELLKKLIIGLLNKTTYQDFEIIIINNDSEKEETFDCFNELILLSKRIKIIDYNQKFNYSTINNFARKFCNGDFLLFLNDDIEIIEKDWLNALIEQAQRPEIGAVGAKLLFPNNKIQHAGVIINKGQIFHAFMHKLESETYLNYSEYIRNYNAVTAACLMMRKNVFDQVFGFDEKFDVIFSDVDICLKIRKFGYLIVYTPLAKLYHLESATRGQIHYINDELYFKQKWSSLLDKNDCYYNPNFNTLPEKSFNWNLN